MLATKKPGDKVEVQFYRHNKLKAVTVTLGNRPASIDNGGQQDQQTFPFP